MSKMLLSNMNLISTIDIKIFMKKCFNQKNQFHAP
jgi:hypothetical protein